MLRGKNEKIGGKVLLYKLPPPFLCQPCPQIRFPWWVMDVDAALGALIQLPYQLKWADSVPNLSVSLVHHNHLSGQVTC